MQVIINDPNIGMKLLSFIKVFCRMSRNKYDLSRVIIISSENLNLVILDRGYSSEYILKRIKEGFGLVLSNHRLKNDIDKLLHIIVLNFKFIKSASLTTREINSVTLHELGHIFNNPPDKELPKLENPNTLSMAELFGGRMKKISKIKDKHEFKREEYADDFAKQYGYSKELISAHNKYLNMPDSINHGLIRKRIETLTNISSEPKLGYIKYVGDQNS